MQMQESLRNAPEDFSKYGIFSIYRLKSPETWGGFTSSMLRVLTFGSLFIPLLGLIGGLIGIASASPIKRLQGKALLLIAVINIVWVLLLNMGVL